MKKNNIIYLSLLLVIALFTNSCSKDIFDPNAYRGKDEIKDNYLVLRPETIMLSAADKTSIKSVNKNEIIIISNSSLSNNILAGSVLVNNGADVGDSIAYYRKVISVISLGDETQLITKNVGLKEAYSKWSIDSRSDKFTIETRSGEWVEHFTLDAGIVGVTFGGKINPNFDVDMKYKSYYFTSAFDSLAIAQALTTGAYIDPTFHLRFEDLEISVEGSFALTQSFELASDFDLPTILVTPIAQTGLALYFSPYIGLSGKVTGMVQSPFYQKTFGPYTVDLSYTIGDLAPVYSSTLKATGQPDTTTRWNISGTGECELQMGGQLSVSVIGGQDLAKCGISFFNYFTPNISHLGDFTSLQPGYDLSLDVGAGVNYFFDFDLLADLLGANWSTEDYKYNLLHLSHIVENCKAYTAADLLYNPAEGIFSLNVGNDDPSRHFYNIFINGDQITDLGNPTFNYNQDYFLNLPATNDPINKIQVFDAIQTGCYLEDSYVDQTAISACTDQVMDSEGNKYCTIEIGQLRWMAENLRTTTSGVQYAGEKNYERRLFGRLYTYDEIMNGHAYSPSTSNEHIQGLCPNGWHLPTISEWNDLAQSLGGFAQAGKNMKLASSVLWPNSALPSENTFNATPAGEYYLWKSGPSAFGNRGKLTKFWTTKIGDQGEVTIIEVGSGTKLQEESNSNADPVFYHSIKDIGYSCRCVEDY